MTPQLWAREMGWEEWRRNHPDLDDREAEYLYQAELKMFRNFQDDIRNQMTIRQAQLTGDLLNVSADITTILNEGGVYIPPPPPPPPPTPPALLSSSVWLDGSDRDSMRIETVNGTEYVFEWSNVSGSALTLGPSILHAQEFLYGLAPGVPPIQENEYVYRDNAMTLTGSFSNGRLVSYGSGSMTFFMLAEKISTTSHELYGGQSTTNGSWEIAATAWGGGFRPYLKMRDAYFNTSRNLYATIPSNQLNANEIFLLEMQVSKSSAAGDTAVELRFIAHQGDNRYTLLYDDMSDFAVTEERQILRTISSSDHVFSGEDSSYTLGTGIPTKYYDLLWFNRLLTEEESTQIYDYFNAVYSTSFAYTASFLP